MAAGCARADSVVPPPSFRLGWNEWPDAPFVWADVSSFGWDDVPLSDSSDEDLPGSSHPDLVEGVGAGLHSAPVQGRPPLHLRAGCASGTVWPCRCHFGLGEMWRCRCRLGPSIIVVGVGDGFVAPVVPEGSAGNAPVAPVTVDDCGTDDCVIELNLVLVVLL